MSMTKAEKAAMQALREQAALTLPPYEEPQSMTVEQIRASCEGNRCIAVWFANSYDSGRVTLGWTNGYSHCREGAIPAPGERNFTASRDCGNCYRTEIEAWRAVRWEITRRVIKQLASVDERIAALPVSQLERRV